MVAAATAAWAAQAPATTFSASPRLHNMVVYGRPRRAAGSVPRATEKAAAVVGKGTLPPPAVLPLSPPVVLPGLPEPVGTLSARLRVLEVTAPFSIVTAEAPSTSTGSKADVAASRRYLSLLPPFLSRPTRLEQFSEGLWGLVQPLKLPVGPAFDIQLRMTVARLPDGSLLLISPLAPTQELLSQLSSLGGPVSHIVLPSSSPEHWFYGPDLSSRFPDATVWVVPGLLEGKGLPIPFFQQLVSSMKPRCKVLGVDPLPEELQGQLETVLLTAPFFIEAAVVLPRHKALLLADTGFCLDAEEYSDLSQFNIDAAAKVGVWDRLGPITRVVFDKFPQEGRAWVEAVLRYEFDVVIPAHASAPVKPGRRAFVDCFDFLYQ